MADLAAASAGLAQLQVRAGEQRPAIPGSQARSAAVCSKAAPVPPLLQAAFGKGDLAACKQLLSRLKVGGALLGGPGGRRRRRVGSALAIALCSPLVFIPPSPHHPPTAGADQAAGAAAGV